MPNYLSGRSKRTPQSGLRDERYRYLSAADAEPNFGDPTAPGESPPPGQQYQIVSVEGHPGERYWVPIGGGLIPGSISVFDEGNLRGGLSSTTQLNFTGLAITAYGSNTGLPDPGIAVTIQVFAPGNNQEILFNTANDFSTSSKLSFDSSAGLLRAGDRIQVGVGGTVISTSADGFVGIGTTNPTQELHVQGDVRITGTIYDYFNSPGSPSFLIAKNNFGGLSWVNPSVIRSGAGGTYQNIQYHNSVGLVDGASNFVYDEVNQRVGIGSTLPTVTLDVLGASKFVGSSQMSQLNVSGITTTQTLAVSGLTTTQNLIVTGVTTLGFVTGTNAYFSGIVTANRFVGDITALNLNVPGIATIGTLKVTGLTTTRNLQVFENTNLNQLNVSGTSTFDSQVSINNLNVSGVGTFDNIKLDTNTVSTLSGNLILDSFGGTTQINDSLYLNDTTESTSKDTGSFITEGGVGIEKNLFVGGQTNLAINGGITTTGGDLYVKGNLFLNNGITVSSISASLDTTNTNRFLPFVDNIGGASVVRANSNLTFNPGLSRLGIGTTNPQGALDVYGQVILSPTDRPTATIYAKSTTSGLVLRGGNDTSVIPSTDNPGANIELYGRDHPLYASNAYYDANTHRFRDKNADQVYVAIGTNVGIGVTFPTDKLDVNGNIRLRRGLKDNNNTLGGSGQFLQSTGDGVSWAAVSGVSSLEVSEDIANTNRYITFIDNISGVTTVRANTNFTFNPGLGRLGIGTTNPQGALDVYGTLTLTTLNTENAILKANGTSTGLALIGGTDDIIGEGGANIELYGKDHPTQPNNAFYDANRHRFRDKDASQVYVAIGTNVGIGVTFPTDKLDVNGDIRLRNGLKDNNNNVGAANSILASTGSGVVWVSAPTVTGLGTTSTPQFAGLGIGTPARSGWNLTLQNSLIQRVITLPATVGLTSTTYTINVQEGNEFSIGTAVTWPTNINLSNVNTIPSGYKWGATLRFPYTSGTISWFSTSGLTIRWDGGVAIIPNEGETEKVIIEIVGGSGEINIAALRGY